jgi:hypothetical protein
MPFPYPYPLPPLSLSPPQTTLTLTLTLTTGRQGWRLLCQANCSPSHLCLQLSLAVYKSDPNPNPNPNANPNANPNPFFFCRPFRVKPIVDRVLAGTKTGGDENDWFVIWAFCCCCLCGPPFYSVVMPWVVVVASSSPFLCDLGLPPIIIDQWGENNQKCDSQPMEKNNPKMMHLSFPFLHYIPRTTLESRCFPHPSPSSNPDPNPSLNRLILILNLTPSP